MMISNKKSHLEQMIFKAKVGSEEDKQKLKNIYSRLTEKIFQTACDLYPFLKNHRFEIFHEFHFMIYKFIRNYNFSQDKLFSYNLQIILIETINKILRNRFGMLDDKILPPDKFKEYIFRPPVNELRLRALQIFKRITPSQKRLIRVHLYENNSYVKSIEILGMRENNFEKGISMTYKRINKRLKPLKTEKKGKPRERVYKIVEIPIEQ